MVSKPWEKGHLMLNKYVVKLFSVSCFSLSTMTAAAAAAYHCFLLCFITAICFKCYTGYLCPADSDSGSLGYWYPTMVSLSTDDFLSLANRFFTGSWSQSYVVTSNYISAFLGLLLFIHADFYRACLGFVHPF
ncbi:hypothetical protein C8J56DRAFT_948754 [Mycena floridula]|nr:hypothetical protein C8J56DRAFT_948754 [Mycena floridula]